MNSIPLIPADESTQSREGVLWGFVQSSDGQVRYALQRTRLVREPGSARGQWETQDATCSVDLDEVDRAEQQFRRERLAAGWEPSIAAAAPQDSSADVFLRCVDDMLDAVDLVLAAAQ